MNFARSLVVAAVLLALLHPTLELRGEPSLPKDAEQRPSRERGPFVLELTSPLPSRAHFPRSVFAMGSRTRDLAYALEACQTEIYGRTCSIKSFQDEAPARKVELSEYWLDRYEVSVADYRHCVRARRCRPIPFHAGARRFDAPRLPASMVSWEDARDYCAFVGARLPTEAEWERAATGRTHRRYPWGDLYNPRLSNHGRLAWDRHDAEDGFAELAPVGSYPAGTTPEAVFDLAGNVEEWALDRYAESYDPRDLRDPRGPSQARADVHRVIRGGSFISPRVQLRAAARDFDLPHRRKATRGFRCAKSNVDVSPG